MANPEVMLLSVSAELLTLNSSASPAPVPAKRSPLASVRVTVTRLDVVWSKATVPNGPDPHVPEQPS